MRKVRDKRKQFKATLILTGLLPGSTHQIRARAKLKTHPGQPPVHRSIRVNFTICG